MDKYFDSHVHTYNSDGIYSFEELCEMALQKNISVMVITDHNIIIGNQELSAVREKYPQIELPLGCEFSCKYTTVEGRLIQLHVGGINITATEEINRIINHNNKSTPIYIGGILSRLETECGINLCTFEELQGMIIAKQPGRKHIAKLLVERGYCKSIKEAFEKYIGDDKPAYFDNVPYLATLEEVVKAIVCSGGVASLCHLFKYELSDLETEALLSEFSKLAGNLGAMEVYYFRYNERQQKQLAALAGRFGLMESAASDYHGDGESKSLGQYPIVLYTKMCKQMKADKYRDDL